MEEDARIEIYLPDLFRNFLKMEPQLNPHYHSVKFESERWLNELCSFPVKIQMKINKCDFSYFLAIAAPRAKQEEFKTLCDWGNWVFPYDDMFDHGELKDQPEMARKIMDSLRSDMLGVECSHEKLPLIKVHDDIFARLTSGSPEGVQRRFVRALSDYCNGALLHVADQSHGNVPSLEDMVKTRRDSAGVSPLYGLVEYVHGLRIPDAIFDDHVVQELEALGKDFVSITNDILSYRKEEIDGVPHNMVAVCRMNGMSAQGAFDAVAELLEDRYQAWDDALAKLPSWGAGVDHEDAGYVEGIKNVVKANLYWSFRSERYLGTNPSEVRRTQKLNVLKIPPFLTKQSNLDLTSKAEKKFTGRMALTTSVSRWPLDKTKSYSISAAEIVGCTLAIWSIYLFLR